MNENDAIAVRGADSELFRKVSEKLIELVGSIPTSGEKAAADPRTRARALVSRAALKSAAISGSLALPPGPLGLMTILPDLYAIWRIQAQLVADIAAVYGKTVFLTRGTMLFCLFKHAAAQAVRDLIVRTGERVLIKSPTLRALRQILAKIGTKTTQRVLGRGASRWVPIVGAIGVAGYAYYDTDAVGRTAMDLFSRDIDGGAGSQFQEVKPKS
jgi:uncharacterized protein (DUF697 family)